MSVDAYTPDIPFVEVHCAAVQLATAQALEARRRQLPHEQLSVTGRSTVPVDPDYERLANAIQRDGLRNERRLNQNGNHNAVDIARIQAGIDVRTTVSVLSSMSIG